MAKTKNRQIDNERTTLLDIKGLSVQMGKGGKNVFYAWNTDEHPESCPSCGGTSYKVQNRFQKTYIDFLTENGIERPITLVYSFYKYKCLSPECRHIFSREIGFASGNYNVTDRMRDRVIELVLSGFPYEQVSLHFSTAISAQAVGQIFNRWVSDHESHRVVRQTPSVLGVVSGVIKNNSYTLYLDLDRETRVLDVQLGVSDTNIRGALRNLGADRVDYLITDCNETINYVVEDTLPSKIHIIPVAYWFALLTSDYKAFAKKVLQKRQEPHKVEKFLNDSQDPIRDKLLRLRPRLNDPYQDYIRLNNLLRRRDEFWVYSELIEWEGSISEDMLSSAELSLMQLQQYQKQIANENFHREVVPERLFQLTSDIETQLKKLRTFSDAQLKARLLYSVPAELDDWRGIPIEAVISALEEMNNQRRRNRYEYE